MYWGYGAYSLPYAWYFLFFGTELDPMDLAPYLKLEVLRLEIIIETVLLSMSLPVP